MTDFDRYVGDRGHYVGLSVPDWDLAASTAVIRVRRGNGTIVEWTATIDEDAEQVLHQLSTVTDDLPSGTDGTWMIQAIVSKIDGSKVRASEWVPFRVGQRLVVTP